MNFKRGYREKRTNSKCFAFGIILAAISFFAIAFAASMILSIIKNPLGSIGLFSFATLLISGSVSGFFTSKYKGDGGALLSLIAAFVFAATLLTVGLIINKGRLPFVTLINLISYIMLAAFFGLVAEKKRSKRRRRR
jgi:hypothetical protein